MRFTKTALLLTLCLLAITACSKEEAKNEDNLKTPQLLPQGKMRSTINSKVVTYNITKSITKNDSTGLLMQIEAISNDNSNKQLKIIIRNVASFPNNTIQCGTLNSKTNSSVQIWYKSGDTSYTCNGLSAKGKIVFTSTSAKAFRGNFWIDAINESNVNKKIKIVGEFNTAIAPEIPEIPIIPPSEITLLINNTSTTFICNSTRKDSFETTVLHLSGSTADFNKALVLEIVDSTANITTKTYPCNLLGGTQYTVAYLNTDSTLYMCNGYDYGNGSITISAISANSISGSIYLTAINTSDTLDIKIITGTFKSNLNIIK